MSAASMLDLRTHLQSSLAGVYRIERELGGAGMSRVFSAEECALGRKVVVKVLPPDLAASVSSERFRREIQFAASLQHPHIVPLLTAGEVDGLPYFTMPFVEGESLAARIARVGPLPVAETISILRDVASALAYAHEHGVVHRDIKPANVLLSSGGAVVTDFGVAKALTAATPDPDAGTTLTSSIVGTPAYMAPEQVAAHPAADSWADHRTDLYALGATAYEMLTGRPPFAGRSHGEVLIAHATETPEPITTRRHDVPVELASLVARCLQKRPADRPQSAAEVVRAVDEIATSVVATRLMHSGHLWAGDDLVRGMFGHDRVHAADSDAPGITSVAVLPFENVGDTRNEYFADGITDELTSALSRLPGLRVASRTSAFTFKGKRRARRDIRKIGGQLNVGAVLEGSVSRSGSQLRVTAMLVNSADGLTLWGGKYTRELRDVFQVQNDIAQAVAGALRVTLAGGTKARLASHGTRDLDAYQLYLKGRFLFNRFTREDLEKSIALYRQALERDPGYAAAWAGIAESWLYLADDFVAPDQAYPQTKEAALKALALDPTIPAAQAALGHVLLAHDWNFPAARRAFDFAAELEPNLFLALLGRHMCLLVAGQLDAAFAVLEHARSLDPLAVVNPLMMGRFLAIIGRYERAIEHYRAALELDEHHPVAHIGVAEALLALGRTAEAEEAARRARTSLGPEGECLLASVEAGLGRGDEARRLVRLLEEESRRSYIRPELIAGVYARLGEHDAAFHWLERAYDARSPYLLALNADRQWDPIRADPRFDALVRRIGLP